MTRRPPRSTLFPTRRSSDLDAVLAQQADLMDAIQRLRAQAQANGKLETTKQQKVMVSQEANKQVIEIEPASPERSEEHTSELQSRRDLVCRLLLEKKNKKNE